MTLRASLEKKMLWKTNGGKIGCCWFSRKKKKSKKKKKNQSNDEKIT